MISWIGGKSSISKWIIEYIPKDINLYCEPFGGAFWVYLKMDLDRYKSLNNVIYNDYNDYLSNFFMCCKDHSNFYKHLSNYQSQNKELFYKFQEELYKTKSKYLMPDFDKASKFAYLCTQVWSGLNSETGKFIDLKGKYKSKFDTFKDKLINEKYIKNINRISCIENQDFEFILNKYDSTKSYFYVDAPYYGFEKYYANHEFGLDTHKRLADCLKNMRGKFSLSYYYFKELEEWFPKDQYTWVEKDFHKAAMAKSGQKQSVGTELLIMNY